MYTHQSSHLYHQHVLYITSTRIFNKFIENPSQMHQSSTSQVYYYKFNITKFNIPTATMETAGVAPRTVPEVSPCPMSSSNMQMYCFFFSLQPCIYRILS